VPDLDAGLAAELGAAGVRWVLVVDASQSCTEKLQALRSAGLVLKCVASMADAKAWWKELGSELKANSDGHFAAVAFQPSYSTLPVLMSISHYMKRLKVLAAYGTDAQRGPYVALSSAFSGTYSKVLFKSENKYRDQFNNIYANQLWSAAGGGSGPGSAVNYTSVVREGLGTILRKYNITSMMDSSCGSMVWMPIALRSMAATQNFKFLGVDVACSLVDKHRQQFANETDWSFQCLDYANEPIPTGYDLVFCRDSLQHVPW
jgi:hypothetical protein